MPRHHLLTLNGWRGCALASLCALSITQRLCHVCFNKTGATALTVMFAPQFRCQSAVMPSKPAFAAA